MKYKVGDKVRIKSLDWYNKKKDIYGHIIFYREDEEDVIFDTMHSEYCGEILTIIAIAYDTRYLMEEDIHDSEWTDEMIEGLVENNNSINYIEVMDEHKIPVKSFSESCSISSNGFYEYTDSDGNKETEWNLPEGYQFVDENGNVINASKIVLEKKKTKYPKTYGECCRVMGVNPTNDLDICEHCDYKTEITYYEDSLLEKIEGLYRLIVCRDAYWKIVGEEMGLGKSWEPDWSNKNELKYCIENRYDKGIHYDVLVHTQKLLAFPTEEMRDAFYENFEEEMENCKELL